MRIIGGKYKGQNLIQPKSRSVRPMSGKVRAAVFDISGPMTDAVVLDAYAGSGAVGLEALSRGAVLVEAIEADPKSAQIVQQNAKNLGIEFEYLLWTMKVETWLAKQESPNTKYDLIVADPPYSRLREDVLDKLGQYLKPGGLMIVSHTSKIPAPGLESVQITQTKQYGDSMLSIYGGAIQSQ